MKFLALTFVLFCAPAIAFQCPKGHSPEKAFQEAVSVHLVRITKTEFYQDVEDGKYAKLLISSYEVVETLKGTEKESGQFLDMLGIGTGFVAALPGLYFLIGFQERPEELNEDYVNMCDVLASAYYLDDPELNQTLKELRASAKDS